MDFLGSDRWTGVEEGNALIHSLDQILVQTGVQTKILPGHGTFATRADPHDYRDMLVQVR